MTETLAKIASLQYRRVNADPLESPPNKKHILVVGGTNLGHLAAIVSKYAVEVSVLVPTGLPALDQEYEIEQAVKFEASLGSGCRSAGVARDLSAIDSDSVDCLVIMTLIPHVKDIFLAQAWRVLKELGKIVVFSATELPRSYLSHFGVAAVTHYPVEGFYAGTMRKRHAAGSKN